MKTSLIYYLTIFTIVMNTSCSDEIVYEKPSIQNSNPSSSNDPYFVSYEKAVEISKMYLSNIGIGKNTRATKELTVDNYYIYKGKRSTRNSNEKAENTEFYIINFSDNSGFSIVPTDSRATQIYAYSNEGNISREDINSNKGLSVFMESAVDYLEDEIINHSVSLPPFLPGEPLDSINLLMTEVVDGVTYRVSTETFRQQYPNFINSTWGYYAPYNDNFPYMNEEIGSGSDRYPVLSGAVAIGQIAAYYSHPYSHGLEIFDWNAIKSQSHFVPDTSTNYNNNCVSTLLSSINDDFGYFDEDGMVKPISSLKSVLTDFNFYYSETGTIVGSITNSYPVICYAKMEGNNNWGVPTNGYYCWLIDGYNLIHTKAKYLEMAYPHDVAFTRDYYYGPYYHCNWGAGGRDDGYYLNTFQRRSEYDYKEVGYIYDIHPNQDF